MAMNWIKIYASTNFHLAEIAKGILIEEEIDAVVVNKRDTAYNTFGEIEVYVRQSDVLRAAHIIKSAEL